MQLSSPVASTNFLAQFTRKYVDNFQFGFIHPTIQVIDKCLVTYAYMTACAVRVQNCWKVYMTLREKLMQIQEEVRAKYAQQKQ